MQNSPLKNGGGDRGRGYQTIGSPSGSTNILAPPLTTLEVLKPFLIMLLVQVCFAGNNILYKIVIYDGMPVSIITAYRQMISAAFTLLLAFIFERNNMPRLTMKLTVISFLNGLLGGSLYQNLYFESLNLISATFITALCNLIPVITFALGVLFGLETLDFHMIACKVKVMGTIIGIGGAMFVTFLKSVELNIWPFHISILDKKQPENHSGSEVLGICYGVLSCLLFSFWLIFQGKMSKSKTYPKHYTSMSLMSVMAALQATAYALCVERDWSQWRLGWDLRLLTVLFSGTLGTGFANVAIAWSVKKKGPLYPVLFNPVELILVVIVASMMLDEPLYLGSLIGAVLIVVSLYMVLWGQNKEIQMQMATQLVEEHIECENNMGTWRAIEEDKDVGHSA